MNRHERIWQKMWLTCMGLTVLLLTGGCSTTGYSTERGATANAAKPLPVSRAAEEADGGVHSIRLTTPPFRVTDQLLIPPMQVNAKYQIDCNDPQERIKIAHVVLVSDPSRLKKLICPGASFTEVAGSPPKNPDLAFRAAHPTLQETTATVSNLSVSVLVMVFQEFIPDPQRPHLARAQFKISASLQVLGLVGTSETDYSWNFTKEQSAQMARGFDADLRRQYVAGQKQSSPPQPYEDWAWGDRVAVPQECTRFEPMAQGATVNRWEEIGHVDLPIVLDPKWPTPQAPQP